MSGEVDQDAYNRLKDAGLSHSAAVALATDEAGGDSLFAGTPLDGANSGLFRGKWSPDKLVWSGDLASGIVAPFSKRKAGANSDLPVVDTTVPPGQPYTHSAKAMIHRTLNTNKSILRLDLAALPKSLSRVKWWTKTVNGGGFSDWGRMRVDVNGIEAFKSEAVNAWAEFEATLSPAATTIDFMTVGQQSDVAEDIGYYITGIRLYATGEPYMLGEFVTYDGEMWESLIDNNPQTPSKVSTSWKRAITLPAPSGTTGQRPDPAVAGAGFMYYDTTLSKPVWSSGAGWKDATGTNA